MTCCIQRVPVCSLPSRRRFGQPPARGSVFQHLYNRWPIIRPARCSSSLWLARPICCTSRLAPGVAAA